MRGDSEAGRRRPAGQSSGAMNGSGQETPLSLLERARTNDADAWRRLVELYRPLVLFWCARARVDPTDAEDVAQGVLVAAAAGLDRFHHDRPGDTFRGWLRTITHNQVLLHVRRNHGRPQAVGGSDAWQSLQAVANPPAGDDVDEQAEVGQLYRRAVEQVRREFEEPHVAGVLADHDRGPLARRPGRRPGHDTRRHPPGQIAGPPPPQARDGRIVSLNLAQCRAASRLQAMLSHPAHYLSWKSLAAATSPTPFPDPDSAWRCCVQVDG